MVSPSAASLPAALRRAVAPPGVLPREALRRAMPQASTQGASPLVGWLLVVSSSGERRQGAWPLAA